MSRNIRKKQPITPVKASKNRRRRVSDSSTSSGSLDLSDEGGYSAVEDISDSSDDDEEDVVAAEEESILKEAQPQSPAPRPLVHVSDEEDDEADDEKNDDDDNDDDDDDDDEPLDDDGDDTGSWGGIMSDGEVDEVLNNANFEDYATFDSDVTYERHVHFDVPSSASSSTETDVEDHADMFPDIFVSQTALDPAFRREIEDDQEEDSDASGTFWDFNYQHGEAAESDAEEIVRQIMEDETHLATPMASQPATAASSPVPTFEAANELNGFDDSEGYTTEEEDEPEPVIRRRHPSNSISEVSESELESPVKFQRGQPRRGRYDTRRSDGKPIAVYNTRTKKMIIFTPDESNQLDLSPEQFHVNWPDDVTSPIMTNPAHMMFSAMLSANTFGDFINGQAMGPTEAFFSLASEANTIDGSSTASIQDEEEDAEHQLDISDFIAWDEDSSGDEGEGNWEPSSTPMRPTTANSDSEVLSHLNSETVGAFRRNQINQQLILSNQATQDSLAFSGPYNYTALKGLRTDRFDTAGVPLTPIRRHKKHLSEQSRSPLDSFSAKRKASGEAAGGGHKRHRSISDVNLLKL